MNNRIEILDIGRMAYREAWDIQRKIQKRLIDQKLSVRDNPDLKKKIPDSLL